MFTNLQATTFNHFGTGLGTHATARRVAIKLFEQVYESGWRGQFLAKLFGKSNELRILSHQPKRASHNPHIVIVPLAKIVGSEGRSNDFDKNFRPLKKHTRERWIGIAVARRTGVSLPAVELVQDGDEFYVRDGHHRISVARMIGQVEIDAKIVN